jgi:hypothetical protein
VLGEDLQQIELTAKSAEATKKAGDAKDDGGTPDAGDASADKPKPEDTPENGDAAVPPAALKT